MRRRSHRRRPRPIDRLAATDESDRLLRSNARTLTDNAHSHAARPRHASAE